MPAGGKYDAGLSDYVAKIEELLKQKLGKDWDECYFRGTACEAIGWHCSTIAI